MPSLNLDTDRNGSSPTQPSNHQSPTRSGSSSPTRPTYSPITPVLSTVRLATPPPAASNPSQQQPRVYTHTQPPQTFIPPPPVPPETISLDSNPDALALRSAISILQIQSRKATSDIQTLHQIKERAVADPLAFADALTAGKIKTTPDPLFGTLEETCPSDSESSNSDYWTSAASINPKTKTSRSTTKSETKPSLIDPAGDTLMTDSRSRSPAWPQLPKPQSIVRTPPINWSQYAIIGESLDKLHADQVARPMEGLPAKVGPDGVAVPVEGGKRHETAGTGVAVPYNPAKDKIERTKRKR